MCGLLSNQSAVRRRGGHPPSDQSGEVHRLWPVRNDVPGLRHRGDQEPMIDDRPKPILLQGNEAIAEGALAAGMRFFGGYPISPSSEIAETLARRLPQLGGTFIQMEDEIASISSIIGASIVGTKSMTATSGPGFSLMQEGIGFAIMAETPVVVVNVQRLGPSSGYATAPAQGDVMQARYG